MTRAERLAVLGEASVAELHRFVDETAARNPMPAEARQDLRPVLAPALTGVRAEHAAQQTPAAA